MRESIEKIDTFATIASLIDCILEKLRESGEISWGGSISSLPIDERIGKIGLDSLEWATVLVEIEQVTGIQIYASDLGKLETVQDFLMFIHKNKNPN